MNKFEIKIAQPRGFCAGVDRAIEIVEQAIKIFGGPIYVRHEIVHNQRVVNDLKEKGTIFVEDINEVPDDSILIFSAHGTGKDLLEKARSRKLKVIDAACPLVTKVHMEAIKYFQQGFSIVLIGHEGHIEVEGTMGQLPKGKIKLVEKVEDIKKLPFSKDENVAVITQTTLSVDDTFEIMESLKEEYMNLVTPKADDICYATQNRQDAVKNLAKECDLILVLGAKNSSNSNRLREVGEKCGIDSYLIDDASQLNLSWLKDVSSVGITAGASAPEVLINDLISKLVNFGGALPKFKEGKVEKVSFPLPVEIQNQ